MDRLAGKGIVEAISVKRVMTVSGHVLSIVKGERTVTSVALR